MINFIKQKFLSLIDKNNLENNKKDIQIYNNITHNSKYALGYAVGVGGALGFCFQSFSFLDAFAISFILGLPLALPGYLIGLPIYNYIKKRNFKMFRKYEYFRKLQDSYFYHEDQVVNMLKNKEHQYIILSLFEYICSYFPQNERISFQNRLFHFKHLLKNENWGLAAKEFLYMYPKYLSYAKEMKDVELSSFDLQMLEAQNSLLHSYLHESEDHSIIEKQVDTLESTQTTSLPVGKFQFQTKKVEKIDWHKLINTK